MVNNRVRREIEDILAEKLPVQQGTSAGIDKIFHRIQKIGIYVLCIDVVIESLEYRASANWKTNSPKLKRMATNSFLEYCAVRTFVNTLFAGSAAFTAIFYRAEDYVLAAFMAIATAGTLKMAIGRYRSSPVNRYWH